MKNGAELLDRLIKDIVAEKASNYVSVAHPHRLSGDQEPESSAGRSPTDRDTSYDDLGAPAFSLPKFIPLLAERIYTLNPFTRMFLVNWISVLDSIPDLELISYLPAFLKGLMQYLTDNNEDVRIATQQTMNGFLQDIRRTTEIKKGLKDRRRLSQVIDESDSASGNSRLPDGPDGRISPIGLTERLPEDNFDETDDWVPGQDVRVDYAEIINILIPFLRERGLSSLTQVGLFFQMSMVFYKLRHYDGSKHSSRFVQMNSYRLHRNCWKRFFLPWHLSILTTKPRRKATRVSRI